MGGLSECLDCTEMGNMSAFCWKNVGFMALFMNLQKSFKHRFQYKFGSWSTIYTFKIILLQCFQFSVFSNKQYSNRPEKLGIQ